MRSAWMWWLYDRAGELGWSDGPLRATVGTVAVLATAALAWVTLHRHHPARLVAAGAVTVLGVCWLALH
ncbi:hypothetical protein ACN20G_00795 [Streptomyces sp. BI20]|uniref:hypothetical protein n=1 Tax=Streptomyces sp. BI20 TaxID=3403460 RepID=UPI003C71017D